MSALSGAERAGVALYVVLLVVLLGVTFGPHLRGEWVWDDVYLVRDNPNLEGASGLRVLLSHDLWKSAGRQQSDLYHPVPMALMWLVSACAGKSVVALRAVNVLLHATCVAVFALWMLRRGLPARGVAVTSLLFAVHPLVTEPVMWITGCHDTLATLGCLVALLAWPNDEDEHPRLRMALVMAATVWAALCKEPYFVFPAILFVQALVCGREKGVFEKMAPVAVPAGALGLVVAWRGHLGIPTGSTRLHASLSTLFVDYATIVSHYLRYSLTFQNGPTTESFRPLPWIYATIVLLGLARVTVFVLARFRTRARATDVLLVGWAWFSIALAPYTIAVPVIGMYGNRYGYFPMMGLAACLLALGEPLRERLRVPPLRVFRWLAPLLVVTLVPFTLSEASLWHDELTLFGADVERNPGDPRALYHYGHAVLMQRGCAEALPFFLEATERDPGYGRAWHNVAGCLVDLHRYEEALGAAEISYRLQPGDPGAAFNLAVVKVGLGDKLGGRALLTEALRLDPQHHAAQRLLAQLSAVDTGTPR